MRKTAFSFIITLTLLILLIPGCERKVVIEEDTMVSSSSCFTCHGDDGLLLAAKGEWQNSVHASGSNVDYTNRGGTDCTRCHDHQGFLDYIATGEVDPPYSSVSAIHCFTCHSPHTNGDLSLRTEASYELENGDIFDHGEGNLCVTCHHSRFDVGEIVAGISVSRYWGPHHGPQGDLLNGSGGYEFDGYEYEFSTHATAVTNACIGCHMGQAQAHDGYKIGGHSFNMIDEETESDLSGLCEECHDNADGYDFVNSDDIDYDHDGEVEGYQTEVEGLLDSLGTLLLAADLIDDTDHPNSGTIDDADVAGALYNFLIIHEDRSEGIHNFKYIVGLLESSIEYMATGVVTNSGVQLLAAH